VALIGAKVLMAKALDVERVPFRGQETEQPANLRVVRADRVRTAVGFELKPAEIFVRCGLEGEWHDEAVADDN
jgi:hypothetical protein